MTETLLQMFLIMGLGVAWRFARPAGVAVADARRVLTTVVFNILLPALILDVLSRHPVGMDSLRISASAAAGVLGSLLLAWWLGRRLRLPDATLGTVLLAAAFPNATYLGLPLLERLFGPTGGGVAIQFDLFACTPLLLTVGILLASRYGSGATLGEVARGLLRVTPLWAALVAVAVQLSGLALPGLILETAHILGQGVVPLMLLALGMSLRFETIPRRDLAALGIIAGVQLVLMPLWVWGAALLVGLPEALRLPVVLEGAMPSMVLGVVLCDRYRLDPQLYATAVTLTTVLALFTLPLWSAWVA